MTKQEKENFGKWNEKQGIAKEKAERNFELLKNLAKKYGLGRYCNAGTNLENIFNCEKASKHDKNLALIYYTDYHICRTRFECLHELLQIF